LTVANDHVGETEQGGPRAGVLRDQTNVADGSHGGGYAPTNLGPSVGRDRGRDAVPHGAIPTLNVRRNLYRPSCQRHHVVGDIAVGCVDVPDSRGRMHTGRPWPFEPEHERPVALVTELRCIGYTYGPEVGRPAFGAALERVESRSDGSERRARHHAEPRKWNQDGDDSCPTRNPPQRGPTPTIRRRGGVARLVSAINSSKHGFLSHAPHVNSDVPFTTRSDGTSRLCA